MKDVPTPDTYPLPRMEDCVDDRAGSASHITFDLLEWYWQVLLTDHAKLMMTSYNTQ